MPVVPAAAGIVALIIKFLSVYGVLMVVKSLAAVGLALAIHTYGVASGLALIQQHIAGLPADLLMVVKVLKIDMAISIILGAVSAKTASRIVLRPLGMANQ
jgi:hypothetical protein